MNDIFKLTDLRNTNTRTFFLKLYQPLPKINHGQKALPDTPPNIWNNVSNSLKATKDLNTYTYTTNTI